MTTRFARFGMALFIMGMVFAVGARTASFAHAATANTNATSSLQSEINAQNAQVTALNAQIAEYQAELQKVGANKKTLQNAINALNIQRSKVETQITATEHQINSTQLQIQQLGTSIAGTEKSIAADQSALEASMRSLAMTDEEPFILQVLSSSNVDEVWNDVDTVARVLKAIQDNVYALQTQKRDLSSSQNASLAKQSTLTNQKNSLTTQQTTLVQTKQTKAELLAETNAQESTYQKLLATAQAELANFSTFTESAGGSGLLKNQTSCDSWGCYYNQRDSSWGHDALNGTSYNLASDGCLITSMAMVMTHYGYHDVTPITINSNPDNFAAYYPAYLLFTINVDGVTATRKTASIDQTLASGNPVVVGLHAYGGTHFVVLTSGSRGTYLMRDPYIANAKDISFSANYSLKDIYEISKVVINS